MTARERDVIRGFLGEAHQEMLTNNATHLVLLEFVDELHLKYEEMLRFNRARD